MRVRCCGWTPVTTSRRARDACAAAGADRDGARPHHRGCRAARCRPEHPRGRGDRVRRDRRRPAIWSRSTSPGSTAGCCWSATSTRTARRSRRAAAAARGRRPSSGSTGTTSSSSTRCPVTTKSGGSQKSWKRSNIRIVEPVMNRPVRDRGRRGPDRHWRARPVVHLRRRPDACLARPDPVATDPRPPPAILLGRRNSDGGYAWSRGMPSDAWATFYCRRPRDLSRRVPHSTRPQVGSPRPGPARRSR